MRKYTENWPRWWTESITVVHSTSIRRTSPTLFGPVGIFIVLFSSASGVLRIRSMSERWRFSYVVITSFSEAGAGGVGWDRSMAPASAPSAKDASATKVQARSLADRHSSCGLRSALAVG